MSQPVTTQRFDRIAVIVVDNPPVNALGHAVREGVCAALENCRTAGDVDAVVLHCEGRTFFAGADIREFGQPPREPSLRDMLAALDDTPLITVAALHGTALGGGFETALCCHYRVATETARVGLPEVNLGLLPGAGGTQRLPRVTGAAKALDMMIGGKPIGAAQAMELGLVDRIVDGDRLLDEAIAFTCDRLAGGDQPLRVRDRPAPDADAAFFADYRARMARRTRGFEAPERIVQCVESAASLPFEEGMTRERELFEACLASPQSAAMRHVFFAERAAARVPGVGKDVAKRAITTVGVVGAGTMGAGIALACISAGLSATLLDKDEDGVKRGRDTIADLLQQQVDKGRIKDAEREERLARLVTTTDYEGFATADLVIEAVFETMSIKETVFAELDRVCRPGAILASNTSTLDVDRIAAATGRPEDVIGLHFFSPAHIMRLLEIVRGDKTSAEVIATSLAFAKTIGKLGVVVGNCFGFVGNRMLYGYGRENQFLLLEGAAPEQIDAALTGWGMAMGPNAVGDLAGLDVGYKVRQARADLPEDPRYYRVADMLAERGRYGQKTGAGTYRYDPGSRTPLPDPEVTTMIEAEAARLGIERRTISDEEIVERCITALIVEGAQILDEGIAAKPGDIDAIWVNGYGFPRYRGGPMWLADTTGAKELVARIASLAERFGERLWPVPPLLAELAGSGQRIAEYGSQT